MDVKHSHTQRVKEKIFGFLMIICIPMVGNVFCPRTTLAAELPPQVKVDLKKLKSQGITPEEIKASIFLKMKTVAPEMKIQEQESVSALKLSAVHFLGDQKQSIWLRTSCDFTRRRFFLEECRGSTCQRTAAVQPVKEEKDRRVFRGEYGNYTLTRARFAKQLLADGLLDVQLCKRSWPAWAVAARSRSASSNLEFPGNLLILQTAKDIFLVNALEGRVWNSFPWNEERGIFSHATVAEDGRILLQSDKQNALYLDFPGGNFLALQNSNIYYSASGTNDLFSSSSQPELKQLDIEALKLVTDHISINLGGIWTKEGFLTWQDLLRSSQMRSQPQWRAYPEDGKLLSARWSEESGLEKTYLLVENGRQFKLYSATEQNTKFSRIRNFGDSGNEDERGIFYVHPDFLTWIRNTGQVWVNVSDKFFSDISLSERPYITQGANALFVRSRLNDGSCQATLYKPRASKSGWQQVHSLFKVPCSTGLGSSPDAASLVEKKADLLDIYVAE